MKKHIAVILAALTLGTLALPVAQAQNAKNWVEIPIAPATYYNSCTGENIIFGEGYVWISVTTVTDGSGGSHNDFQFRAKLDGVGETSGKTYSINNSAHETSNASGSNLGSNDTFTQHWKLISQGSGDNGAIRTTIHVTLNAKGNLTANVFSDLENDCF